MSENSESFVAANQLVSFDKDALGGFYIHSWHPSKTEMGAYGVDSRVLSLISLVDGRMTLQTPVVDSIGTMLMKGVGTDDSGRIFATATVIEMFSLASSIPDFEKQYKSVSDIPADFIQAASDEIKVFLYSSRQTIQVLGEPEFDDESDDGTWLSLPIQLSEVTHEMEIEINGKWVPYTLRVPAIYGVVHVEFNQHTYQGGTPTAKGLTISFPMGAELTLSDENLSLLAMTGTLSLPI